MFIHIFVFHYIHIFMVYAKIQHIAWIYYNFKFSFKQVFENLIAEYFKAFYMIEALIFLTIPNYKEAVTKDFMNY